MDELREAPETRMLTMSAAAVYMGISKERLKQAIERGEVLGVTKGAEKRGPAGGWRIPQAELDRLKTEGKLKPVPKLSKVTPERLTIADAAKRFNLGPNTLRNYIANGELSAEKAQLGLGKQKTFVKTAEVAALRARIPVSQRGKHPKTGVTPKAPKAVIAAGNDLNSELLCIADLVRNGQFTVSRLSVALEFAGGGE